MRLHIKITPLEAGTAAPVDESRLFSAPPDLEPDQILSFLTFFFGEGPIEIAWTSTARHERLGIGWIFPGRVHGDMLMDNVELLCVPVVEVGDEYKSFFELMADQPCKSTPSTEPRRDPARHRGLPARGRLPDQPFRHCAQVPKFR